MISQNAINREHTTRKQPIITNISKRKRKTNCVSLWDIKLDTVKPDVIISDLCFIMIRISVVHKPLQLIHFS